MRANKEVNVMILAVDDDGNFIRMESYLKAIIDKFRGFITALQITQHSPFDTPCFPQLNTCKLCFFVMKADIDSFPQMNR